MRTSSTAADEPAATRFSLGEIVETSRARVALARAHWSLTELLNRHRAGDWGDVSETQRRLNNAGIAAEANLLSEFTLPDGQRVTIFTRADRTHTLVHLAPPRS